MLYHEFALACPKCGAELPTKRILFRSDYTIIIDGTCKCGAEAAQNINLLDAAAQCRIMDGDIIQ